MDISLLKRLALAPDHRRFDAAGPGAEALMVTAALFQGAVDKEPQDGLGTVFRVCTSLAKGQKPISINGVDFRTSSRLDPKKTEKEWRAGGENRRCEKVFCKDVKQAQTR